MRGWGEGDFEVGFRGGVVDRKTHVESAGKFLGAEGFAEEGWCKVRGLGEDRREVWGDAVAKDHDASPRVLCVEFAEGGVGVGGELVSEDEVRGDGAEWWEDLHAKIACCASDE